jgi:murein DD-endopeptidase MepM/ murein hydrolase activator NlpD
MTFLLSFLLLFVSHQGINCDLAGTQALHGAAYPLAQDRVSSSFGVRKDPMTGKPRLHAGIDLVVIGDPEVRSIDEGLVVFAGPLGDYGNLVSVKHAEGISSHYAHLAYISVHVGDRVKQGAIVGVVGATGRATNEHLHFEIRRYGCPSNPIHALPALGGKAFG